jgi:hypothetical protein
MLESLLLLASFPSTPTASWRPSAAEISTIAAWHHSLQPLLLAGVLLLLESLLSFPSTPTASWRPDAAGISAIFPFYPYC